MRGRIATGVPAARVLLNWGSSHRASYQEITMSFRIGALLCLTSLAACSNTNNEPPNTADSYDTTSSTAARSDADMTPASLEGSSTPPRAAGASDDTAAASTTGSQAPLTTGANTQDPAPMAGTDAAPRTPPGTQPDNTKVNERDTKSATPTPMDQGNNESDLKITQQIRQAVMANDSLSFTAKNIKIITSGGKVTLRGPVKTEQERSAIEAAARKVAGAQVDNQIEVKK
jgi:hyperosmotically inducible protein